MTTQTLALPARLLTRLGCVFAFARSMAILLAKMRAAFQRLPTNLTATRIGEPARHIFHDLLTTQTFLLGEERALGTSVGVSVAVMCSLRVTARLGPLAWERAWRRLSATWLWRIQDGSSAVARNLLKDCFSTGIAGALVAELRACVSSAFQRSTTNSCANMLGFNFLVKWAKMGLELLA